jgi:mycofactocin precursor
MTSTVTESVVTATTEQTEQTEPIGEVLAELLVEEISIDGMCGVY